MMMRDPLKFFPSSSSKPQATSLRYEFAFSADWKKISSDESKVEKYAKEKTQQSYHVLSLDVWIISLLVSSIAIAGVLLWQPFLDTHVAVLLVYLYAFLTYVLANEEFIIFSSDFRRSP